MLVADPNSPDFNTYASVVDLRAFAAGRGYTVPCARSSGRAWMLK